jgi:hypothetical protein
MTNILPVFIVIAIALVIVFAELIKKLDGKNRLKGYRVWIPAVLSCGAAWLLRVGDFFQLQQVWFWWAVIFAFSTFAYEAILKKITTALGDKEIPL